MARVPAEVIFSHGTHVTDYAVSCEDCHGDVGQSDVIPAASAVPKDECMTCHAGAPGPRPCG